MRFICVLFAYDPLEFPFEGAHQIVKYFNLALVSTHP